MSSERVESFRNYLLNRKSEKTTKNYISTLERYEEWLKGKAPDEKNAEAFINYLGVRGNSNKSLNRHLSALKTFFKKILHKELEIDGYSVQKKLPVWLTSEEQDKILGVCNTKYEKALIVVFLKTGVRVSEIVTIKPGDFQKVHDGYVLKVLGKGAKERLIPTAEVVISVVTDYVEDKGGGEGYIFEQAQQRIEEKVHELAQRAGIKKNISAHKLRHSYASRYYADTKDIAGLRDNLGHESISTTGIYTHVDSDTRVRNLPDSMKRI